jgi:hypothetical protein
MSGRSLRQGVSGAAKMTSKLSAANSRLVNPRVQSRALYLNAIQVSTDEYTQLNTENLFANDLQVTDPM